MEVITFKMNTLLVSLDGISYININISIVINTTNIEIRHRTELEAADECGKYHRFESPIFQK